MEQTEIYGIRPVIRIQPFFFFVFFNSRTIFPFLIDDFRTSLYYGNIFFPYKWIFVLRAPSCRRAVDGAEAYLGAVRLARGRHLEPNQMYSSPFRPL